MTTTALLTCFALTAISILCLRVLRHLLVERCQDVAVEGLSPSSSARDQERAGEKLRKCAIDCCTCYQKQIPQLQKNIMQS